MRTIVFFNVAAFNNMKIHPILVAAPSFQKYWRHLRQYCVSVIFDEVSADSIVLYFLWLWLQSGTSSYSTPCSAFIMGLSRAEPTLTFPPFTPLFYANGCSNDIYRSEVYATCNTAAEPRTHNRHTHTHTHTAEKTKCPP